MADNSTLPATGDIIHTDEYTHTTLGTGKTQLVKLVDGTLNSSLPLNVVEDQASASGDPGIVAMARRTDVPANQSGTDGDYEPLQVSGGMLWTTALGKPFTVQTDVTRPADTAVYANGDAISNSTTAPTTGGFTLSNIARKSGGSVWITDVTVSSSNDPATRLSGEVFLFNQAVTNINDNAAFVVSDTEIKTCVGVIPFSLFDAGNNGFAHLASLSIVATCVGSADLRFLLRARNAYTPASAEVITVTVKGFQVD